MGSISAMFPCDDEASKPIPVYGSLLYAVVDPIVYLSSVTFPPSLVLAMRVMAMVVRD